MPEVGDRVSVASKSGPRLGVVVSISGSLLRVRWESGEETSLIPGPGTLTVLGKMSKRSSGAAKAAKVQPGRASANAKAKTPTTKKATAKRTPSKKKAATKKSVAATSAKRASQATDKKAAAAEFSQKKKAPPAKKPARKVR